ncbi:sugar phosphate isomerase/epimerase [Streptomyces sp. MBT62]|uniref:sugar phosphate isomerase/epimerase family protein n=1 Tax=Streptomyces sp. MBT62 TaxID=2800410 RepID=UPI00190CFC44|nr:TIM barrel protein [Streptomyces sp. MBT62]MBK3571488.1 sugar phosphate isomerase/epimerase [Streptomyces sp. MBT62]
MNHVGESERSGPSIGLEHLSLREEPLSVFVAAAAAGGAESICLSVNHPEVRDGKVLRESMSRLDALSIPVTMGDGFILRAGGDLDDLRRRLDILPDMRTRFANTCAYEPDPDAERDPLAVADLLGEFCRIARTAQVEVLLEFTPLSHVPSLSAAVELLKQLDQPNLGILLDTLHLVRAGEGPADLRAIDQQLIRYCQLSDGLLTSGSLSAYLDEANNDRLIPGQGEFPLVDILSLVPREVTISAEVPLQRLQRAGVSPQERARRILDESRRLVAEART